MAGIIISNKHLIQTPIQLYKILYRIVRRIPGEDEQAYYYNYVRNQYRSHSDETEPDRVKFIIESSISKAEWLMKKYSIEKLN
jgi:hypothetical protein